MQQTFVANEIYRRHPPLYDQTRCLVAIPVVDKYKNLKGYAVTVTRLAEYLLQYSYHVKRDSAGKEYVASSIELSMHELVKGEKAPPGHVIDHENGDGFDNRPENLRFLTHSQNAQNKDKKEGCTTGSIGVYLRDNKWKAYMSVDSKMVHLGTFSNEKEAATMYDVHRVATLGPTCKTNGRLTAYQIEWIGKYGIPDEYKKVSRKDKALPTNITETPSRTFSYQKLHQGKKYQKNFKTLAEALEHKEKMEALFAHEAQVFENERASKITRNAQGIAVVYATRKGIEYEIWVDDDLWPELSKITWQLNKDGYATTNKKNGQYCMHRYIWVKIKGEIPPILTVDHYNPAFKHDNRIGNLRLASQSVQVHNQLKRKSSIDKYKGVQFKWPNYVAIIGHTRYGKYPRAEDAAQRANEEYAKMFEGQATLNVIDWNITTTKENRITPEMITREFIENLEYVHDFGNLLQVMKLDTGNGGPFQLKIFRGNHIPELRKYLLDTYFPLPIKEITTVTVKLV
jgi:hypothetical protein